MKSCPLLSPVSSSKSRSWPGNQKGMKSVKQCSSPWMSQARSGLDASQSQSDVPAHSRPKNRLPPPQIKTSHWQSACCLSYDSLGLGSTFKNLLEDYHQDQGLALAWRAHVLWSMSLSFSTPQLWQLKQSTACSMVRSFLGKMK